jgi:hypothetical protein
MQSAQMLPDFQSGSLMIIKCALSIITPSGTVFIGSYSCVVNFFRNFFDFLMPKHLQKHSVAIYWSHYYFGNSVIQRTGIQQFACRMPFNLAPYISNG